ncbi:hypothetical protein V2J09_023234 [Rumex salicifolius]
MESAMDASQSNSGSGTPEQPPITAGEKPQEAEIRGGGETVEDEVLVSKAQKLMNMITSSQENPNPKVLHALASILENQEARYMKETGHSSPNNASARSSHVIGRLATIIRENDDFFELIASTYLSETRYSMAVQAAASRLLLSCSPTWMFPHVFEEEVLENIKVWAMDDDASSSAGHRKPDLGQSKSSDFEMRKTYSTGLLAVCLTGAGQLLEDVLTSGLSSKLMHYLRIRVLGETSASQHSHITENRSLNTVSGRGRDDGRARMNQPMDAVPFGETRTLENGSLLDPRTGRNDDSNAGRLVHGEEDWIKGEHNGDLVQVTDVDKLKTHERNCAGRSSGNEDVDDNVRDDSYRRKLTRSSSRSRDRTRVYEGASGNEQSIVSPVSGSRLAQSNSIVDRNLLKSLDCKEVADGTKVTIRTVADKSAPEKEDFDSYRVGARDITDLVKSAVRAAEAEARAANAPVEAVKAAGDAAAELVKSAAVDEFKATNDEDSAVLAASRAASTVIDAAAAIEATRNSRSEVADASVSGAGDTESIEDIVDVMIPDCELLAQHREKFCIQCLVILGEYIEVLGPVMQEKGVDVCLVLLQRYSKLTDEIEAAILLPDVLKLICALAAHKKFAALFVDRGGMQKLLAVPRVSYTLFGLSSCLFTIGSLQGVMEHVCTLPSHIVHEVVQVGLLLLECSQDQARKNAALFFAAVFAFRAVLDAFDALDGLQKLLGHLNEAASVRSGVNSGTLGSTGSHRNDRSNEVLTSSEKQIAYHTSVALRQYFRAQLLLLVDSLRPNKSSRSAARNIPSVKAAYKPLDISNEAMDTLLLQIQKDRKLGPAFARARWSAVDKFLACNGHVTMLELCQAPPVERYLHDLLQYALGVLQIVTLVPYSRKLIVTTTLSNNRVGIAVILDAASGPGYSDPEIVQQALNVLVNLVCPPPSISNKPSQLIQGNHSLSVQGSSGPGTENRERNSEQNPTDRAMPNQSEPRERNSSEAIQIPVASGLVGDRRISLGAGAGCAGLAAQLEQGYRQARDAVRSNSGIKILLQLIQTRIVTPPAMLDCLRALACRVLLGLARDETIAHILTKLQVGKKLSELIRDLSSQASGTEQSRWQTELTQIVTNSGRASTLAATDAATPTLRRIERAAIAAATPISYHSRELLMLIHEHLQACGLSSSAATLLKEAQLTPLASMVAPSSLAHHVSTQEIPSFQIQWPCTRTSGGFFSNGLKALAGQDPDQSKCDTDDSVKKKPLVFSSSLSASRSHNHQSSDLETPIFRKAHSTSVKFTESPSTVETPMASVGKSAVDSETQTKTPIVLPMKRKPTEVKEINLTSVKRQNTGDLGLRSPSFQTPNSGRRMNFFDSSGFFTPVSGLKDSLGRRSNTLHSDILDESAQQCETPAGFSQQGLSTDLQSGGTDRLSLDSIVVQYLKHQHRQCPAPITTLPPLSLLHPHVCPEPRRSLDTPSNVTARLSTREYRSMYGGTHGNRRDRQFVYSRFRPMRSCRDDASTLLTSMTFLRDSQLAAGFHTGELKTFDTYNSTVLETCVGHQSPITMVESFWGDDTQLLLSSSTFDVKLWDASSITGGPIHWFEDCRTAKFGHSGTVLAALSADTSERNILVYDVRTFQLDQKLSDTSATSSRGQSYSLVHFSPDDTLLLWNGVLWDRRSSSHVHRFDQFTDYGGGGFHPAGNEVIINSEVWDLRKFRLLRSVPSLDQTTITFNCQGDILYAILRRNLDDAMSAVQARRAKHPLFAAFRTLDAINYSDIATTSVDRCVLDFATEPTDSIVGLVTLDDPADMASSARIYEIGRRRPTDDDSDPDDAEESEDEDDEDDDDIDGDPILGPILEGDEDSGNDGSDDDDDDGGSALEDDDDDDLDDEDVDFFVNQVGLNGGGGMLEIMSDGDDDDDSEDDLLDSYSSDDDEFMGNDFMR